MHGSLSAIAERLGILMHVFLVGDCVVNVCHYFVFSQSSTVLFKFTVTEKRNKLKLKKQNQLIHRKVTLSEKCIE